MHSKDDAMLTRLLIGTLATFLLIWAVGWWVQGKDGVSISTEDDLSEEPSSTRELSGAAAQLSRYGLSALVGSLGFCWHGSPCAAPAAPNGHSGAQAEPVKSNETGVVAKLVSSGLLVIGLVDPGGDR